MTVVAHKETGSFIARPNEKRLKCMSYEDTLREMEAFLDGKIDTKQSSEDVYADITEPVNCSAIGVPESGDPEATECSSSFDDTTSRSDNVSGASDAEVESEFHVDDGLASKFDGYSCVFPMRKRKLTAHWRKFIRPLMWRCKWTELRIKELEAQALGYSRKLATNDQAKMLELHQYTSEYCSKSFPFFGHCVKRKAMKRRKRRQVENVTDTASYMSHHHIFSYLESKKGDQDSNSTIDHIGNTDQYPKNNDFNVNTDWLTDGEDSLEKILCKIETVHVRVHQLRANLDMIMVKNGVKFSSYENLTLLAPYDGQASAAPSPDFSTGNGDAMSIGAIYDPCQNLSDFEIGDLVLPDSVISSYRDATRIPDIIESTVGLLLETDVTLHQPQIVESGENTLDEALIHNPGAQDCHTPYEINDIVKPEKPDEAAINISEIPPSLGPVADHVAQDDSKSASGFVSEIQIPKNKRKRGERKAGPGGWNLRGSGEPDSQ